MNNSYYVGSFREDGLNGPNRGWIVGTFIANAPRKNEEVEIKYWEFKTGENVGHGTKVSAIIECTFILKGKTKCLIGDDIIELKQGDYIVIQPGTPNNTVAEILEDTAGLTIKAPSDPTAKKLVE
jgi:mannose-6-phosphate isomerase-like protein (cupin superfamily)